jgi:hypothetical protein
VYTEFIYQQDCVIASFPGYHARPVITKRSMDDDDDADIFAPCSIGL